MYRSILTLLALTVGSFLYAQDHFCGTDTFRAKMLKDTSFVTERSTIENSLYNLNNAHGIGPNDTIITIPLVIHIIHKGEKIGTGSNLDDKLIHEAIQGLNDRFSGKIGSSPDTKIRFCLAVRDPDGKLTSGITRTDGRVVTDYEKYGMSMFSGTKGAPEKKVKDLSRWPTTEYYNIWIVHNVVNFAGYAYFPGLTANPYDGVAIAARTIGYYNSILTHEVGHGLNLFHVFEQSYNSCPNYSNCAKMDDRVCDTPPSVDLGNGHCQPYNPCKSSLVWLDNRRNYMSYCVDFDRFTNGQIDRMRNAIHTTIRDSLRFSLACVPPQQNDAGITEFIICDSTIKVVLKNFGGNSLRKATVPFRIDNRKPTSYKWTGQLATYQTDTFIINTGSILADTARHITCWTEMPNGVSDSFPDNDTALLNDVYKPLKGGSYTVGSNASDFKDVSAFVGALSRRGICGSVTFNIQSGQYSDQIDLSEIRGASEKNTITIQSRARHRDSVLIEHKIIGANDNFIFRFNGTDHVTIRDISLKVTGNQFYSTLLRMNNSASNNNIINCSFTGQKNMLGSQPIGALVHIGESIDSANVFQGNTFHNGAYGLYMKGVSSIGQGLVLDSNSFLGQRFMAVFLHDQYSPKIRNNTITATGLMLNGINMTNCLDDIQIVNNKIGGNVVNCLDLYFCESRRAKRGLIANNYLQAGATLVNSTLHKIGVKLNYCDRLNLVHNTIAITGSDTLSSAFHCSRSYNLDIYNNSFNNLAGGYALYYGYSDHRANNVDYNNNYTNGGYLAYYNSNIKSLQGWRISSNKDARSLSLNPLFISDSSYRMCEKRLYNAGFKNQAVPQDIEGKIRKTPNPSIGALEQHFVKLDLGEDTSVCDSIVIRSNLSHDKHFWNTGDTSAFIKVDSSGTYKLEVKNSCFSQTDSIQIRVETEPELSLGNDTTLCKFDSINVRNGFNSYLWNTGDTINQIEVKDSGEYWLVVANNCGTGSDTVSVKMDSIPEVNLGNDTTICDSLRITIPVKANYLWGDSSSKNSYLVRNSGLVWLRLQNQCGSFRDSIDIQIESKPKIDLGDDTTVCEQYRLEINDTNYNVLWNTGDTTSHILIDTTGIYTAEVTSKRKCKFRLDSILVTIAPPPKPDLGPDTSVKIGSMVHLTTNKPYRTYLWSTGSDRDTLVFERNEDSVMVISVQVADSNGCTGFDTIQVFILEVVGFPNKANVSRIAVYPNPVGSVLHVSHQHEGHFFDLSVVNNLGQEVISEKIESVDTSINMGHLLPGQYTLKLNEVNGEISYQVKLVVVR